MLTLPEDLVILAVGAKPRSGPSNGKLSWRFGYGVRGAVLVALALAGRVEVADGTIVVRDQAPVGDEDLDEALASLTAPGGVPAGDWMKGSPASFAVPWFRRLEAAGLLRSETVWLLFIAKREGYRLADRARYESLRAATRETVQAAIHASVRAAVSAASTASHHDGGTASHHHGGSSSGSDSSSSHHH